MSFPGMAVTDVPADGFCGYHALVKANASNRNPDAPDFENAKELMAAIHQCDFLRFAIPESHFVKPCF